MTKNIKVNELKITARLKDNNRVLALTDDVNNEVKTIAKQNLITSLISNIENNLITNNGGLFVDGNKIDELVQLLKQIQAENADKIGQPIFTMSNILLENEIWLEGATVSREEYAQLFAIYGTTYGAGNGSTTFKLPDWRNRVLCGASNFGYIEPSLPNIRGEFTNSDDQYATGAFYVTNKSIGNDSGSKTQWIYGFDASRSNPIYKDGATVQQAGVKCRVKTRFK